VRPAPVGTLDFSAGRLSGQVPRGHFTQNNGPGRAVDRWELAVMPIQRDMCSDVRPTRSLDGTEVVVADERIVLRDIGIPRFR
jgi:hypothetical protein